MERPVPNRRIVRQIGYESKTDSLRRGEGAAQGEIWSDLAAERAQSS